MSTIRISEESRNILRELSTLEGETMQKVLDRAVESYRRKVFLDGLNADFQALRDDPAAWREEEEERALFDRALLDGLESEGK